MRMSGSTKGGRRGMDAYFNDRGAVSPCLDEIARVRVGDRALSNRPNEPCPAFAQIELSDGKRSLLVRSHGA